MNWGDYATTNDEKVSLLNNALKEKLEEINDYIKNNNLESTDNGTIGKLIDTVNTNLDVSKKEDGLFYPVNSNARSWGKVYLDMTEIKTSFTDIVGKVNFVISKITGFLKEYSDGLTDANYPDDKDDNVFIATEEVCEFIINDTFGSTDKKLENILTELMGNDDLGTDKDNGFRKLLKVFVANNR